MKKYIHAGWAGLFIINFISVFGLVFGSFGSVASAMMMVPDFPPACCSNVLFIPGVEGSRLYKSGLLSENQLWEPNRNGDVAKLYLDKNGKSIDQSIYTRDIINSTNYPAFNLDVYESFSRSMDAMVDDGDINSWEALPYDWRLDYKDIISDGVKINGDGATTSVIQTVKNLAASSLSGKVTIVAHSNGGLLTKVLIDELVKEGISDLVDNLILIAVPQLGTPQSIPAILHGYGQDLLNGDLLSHYVARALAENMPTAYNLLPSEKYISQNPGPLVSFDQSIDTISNLRKVYGDGISDQATLDSFLLGIADNRTKPNLADVLIPNVLNAELLSNAKIVHQNLDNWTAPSNVIVSQIVGWGLDTLTGFKYQKATVNICETLCQDKVILDHRPIFDFHGDGVVMKSSAEAMPVSAYYVNLSAINIAQNTNRAHGDMLETDAVRAMVKNIVTGQIDFLPDNVTTSLPSSTNKNALQISIHSPVILNLYDAIGNHTGPVANPDLNSDITFYETKIPNSYYQSFGEGVYAGINDSGSTTVSLQGSGVGSFTLEIKNVSEASTTQTIFEDVPVLPTTIATLDTSTASQKLIVDLNGDGKTDMVVAPNNAPQVFDPISYLQTMQTVIASFGLDQKIEKQIDKKIDNLVSLIKKSKISKVDKKIQTFFNSAKLTKKHKKITTDDQNTIIKMLNNLLDNIK